MARVSSIKTLPPDVRAELDSRLRKSGYGGVIGVAAWLTEHGGVVVSKSAVHRYAQELKARDSVVERASSLITSAARNNEERHEVIELLVELGMARLREAQIVARLTALGVG